MDQKHRSLITKISRDPTMEIIEKSFDADADADDSSSSSLNRLPDEILLQIFTKLLDLKTLCFCHLVSRRFSSIVLQVDAISFVAPLLNRPNSGNVTSAGDIDGGGGGGGGGFHKKLFWFLINGFVFKPLHLLRRMVVASGRPLPPIISSFYGESFRSAVSFLSKFRGVRSLCIELPSSSHRGIDNRCLFKWKVKFGNRIESFVFLSPNSVCETNGLRINGNGNEEVDMELSNDLFKQKVHIAFQCLKDVIVRHRMLLYFVKDLPLLENVSITDSGRRGRVSLCGEKLGEVKEWIHSASESVKPQLNRIEVPVSVSQCYVPVLDVPVSGYVMKGTTLVAMEMNDSRGGDDGFVNGEDGFEDKEEAAYSEAVVEILEKHKGRMKRLL